MKFDNEITISRHFVIYKFMQDIVTMDQVVHSMHSDATSKPGHSKLLLYCF